MSKKKMELPFGVKRVEHKIFLHYTPNAIKQNIEDFKKLAESEGQKEVANLYEDVCKILDWAFARLPMVKPPKDNGTDKE